MLYYSVLGSRVLTVEGIKKATGNMKDLGTRLEEKRDTHSQNETLSEMPLFTLIKAVTPFHHHFFI